MREKFIGFWNKYGKIIDIVYIAVLTSVSLSLAFNRSVWLDESLSLRWGSLNWNAMFHVLAADVHPPLHYIMLKLVLLFTGESYYAAKFFVVAGFAVMLSSGYYFLKKLAGKSGAFFYTLCVLSFPFMLVKTVEIRMYSWSMAFAVLTGVAAYFVLKEKTRKYWILFTLAALASAYNHYYGLLTMVFVYPLIVLYFLLIKDWKSVKNWFLCCVATVVGYLPWFFIAIKQVTAVNGSYWIEGPFGPMHYLKELLRVDAFPHSTKVYCLIIAALTLILVWKYIQERSVEAYWGVAVTVPFWGVLGFGILYSKLVKPILISRYLMIPLVLLVLGIAVACKHVPKLIVAGMCAFFIVMAVINYPSVYAAEYDTETEKTLEFIEENWHGESVVYTHEGLESVILYYMPGSNPSSIQRTDILKEEYDELWVLDNKKFVEENKEELTKKGIHAEEFREYGFDNVPFDIYILKREQNE